MPRDGAQGTSGVGDRLARLESRVERVEQDVQDDRRAADSADDRLTKIGERVASVEGRNAVWSVIAAAVTAGGVTLIVWVIQHK